MAVWQNGRMVESYWLSGGQQRCIVAEWRSDGVAEWQNGQMAEWLHGQRVEWQMVDWQNGQMTDWQTTRVEE